MFSRIRNLKVFLKDPDKKGILRMIKEIIHYGWVKKEFPLDYFRKYLYRTDVSNYTNYLSLKQYYSIVYSPKILVPEIASILDNKLSFALICEKNKLPVPKLISYNLKHQFLYNEIIYIINSKQELIVFFNTVFKESNLNTLFLKLFKGMGGKGAILIEKTKLEAYINQYGDEILNNCYIHQETVKQHPNVSTMHAGSVNTLRIESYLDRNNNSHILSAVMRFGIGRSITDNASSGGFYVSVNLKTETLRGKGRQGVAKGGRLFTKHPDTNTIIDGFKIPYLKEALELAKNTVRYFPTRLIGWDIAITENGPVIIEANSLPSLHLTDVAYGGYCNHPLIKDILKEIKT